MDSTDLEKMKSNRRKQSKPIRVSYSAENDSTEPPFANPEQEEFVNGRNETEQKNSKEEVQQSVPSIPSIKNSDDSRSPSYLEEHIRSLAKSVVNPRLEFGFPTEYHRLANEFQQLHKFSNGHGDRENVPVQDRNGSDSSRDTKDENSDGTNRIFHPDAYCEICNREFCNKYFLKTHKANKHGIYENIPSPFPGNALPPSMVLPRESTTSPSFKMDFQSMSPAPQPVPVVPVPTSVMQPVPLTVPQTTLPAVPPPSVPQPVNPTETLNLSISSEKSINQDMEDFCDLCQKHFCNKYYLKKHKNDVHGIPPTDVLAVTKRRILPPLQSSLDPIIPCSTAVITSSSSMIPQSIASMGGLPNMPGVMVLNPFMPPILVPAQNLFHQAPLPAQPPTSLISQPLIASTFAESATAPTMSIAGSSPNMGMVSDALRGIGVLNTEAYCELCRKEFCSKYFLRIHRANKHGIYDEESPTSHSPPTPTSIMPSLPTSSSGPSLTPPRKSSIETADIPDGHSINSLTEFNKDMKNEPSFTKDLKPEPEHSKDVKQEPSPNSISPTNVTISNPLCADNYVLYCNLCNQEFTSKYSYRIHRIQIHGMLNEGLLDDIMGMGLSREDMSRYTSAPQNAEENSLEENGNEVTTMFGTMVAAKLADRVTCDICNKELCNKYFLKAHKFKVHGIDATIQDKENKSAAQTVETIRNIMKQQEAKQLLAATPISKPMPILPRTESLKELAASPTIEKPSKEELVKLGIDPEAYCEICKKEFCSKYFLRTHKQNIHGIPNGKDSLDSEKSGQKTPTKPLNLSNSSNIPINLGVSDIFKNGYEKHTWRWKEPVNSSRVSCELCNRELCNKYFLRTHMINKHGIMQGNLSPNSETESNSPQPTDLSMRDRDCEKNTDIDFIFPPKTEYYSPFLQPQQDDKVQRLTPPDDFGLSKKTEDEMAINNRYYNHYTEVCHLCDRRFRSAKWLKAHILKDHAGLPARSPVWDRFFPFSSLGMPLEQRTCQICRLTYPSELSMQLHMIQEHNAQVTLKSDTPPPVSHTPKISGSVAKYALKRRFSFASKQKLYSCGACDYKTKWLSNLNSHEVSEHNIRRNSMHACKSCKKAFITEKSFLVHVQKRHGGDSEQTKNRVSKKRFRCMSCQQSFLSPIHCHHHIRQVHIRGKSLRKVGKLSKEPLLCKLCPYSSRFAKQLQHHMIRVHGNHRNQTHAKFHSQDLTVEDSCSGTNCSEPMNVHAKVTENCEGQYEMQAFQLQDCCQNSNFVTSVIKMPVRQRVSESVAVTFLLAPAEV